MKHKLIIILLVLCANVNTIRSQQSTVCFPITDTKIYSSRWSYIPFKILDDKYLDRHIIVFHFLEKRHLRFQVNADIYDTWTDTFFSYDSVWVDFPEITIYGREDKELNYVLYKDRNRRSQKYIFSVFEAKGEFPVLDYKDGWYKVILIHDNNKYILWLPPESQCNDYFGSCN